MIIKCLNTLQVFHYDYSVSINDGNASLDPRNYSYKEKLMVLLYGILLGGKMELSERRVLRLPIEYYQIKKQTACNIEETF